MFHYQPQAKSCVILVQILHKVKPCNAQRNFILDSTGLSQHVKC